MNNKSIILVAEDDGEDIFMMNRAIGKMSPPVTLHVVENGEEMIQYLSGKLKYSDRTLFPLPSLIVLDIKMPRNDGFEVLAWLKKEGTLTHIPVVMITSSRMLSDINTARELGARAHLVKPVAADHLRELFASPEAFLSSHPYEVLSETGNRGNTDFIRNLG